jgi:hypothetical protein
MISEAESFAHIGIAAGISTALLCFGLRGTKPPRGSSSTANERRSRRWPSISGGVIGTVMTGVVAVADDMRPWELPGGAISIALILGGGLLLAGWLVRKGLRGRRVGDHPFCRHCGFDLFGRPASSKVCNECGSSLENESAAIAIGTHERRMVPLAIGLFLFIVLGASITPSLGRGYRWASTKDWSRYKPASWLVSNLAPAGGLRLRDHSLEELWRRLAAGSLDSETIATVIDHYLAASKATSRPASGINWEISTAVSFMEQGWQTGKLDEATARRTLQAMLDLELRVAPMAARGCTLRYALVPSDWSLVRANRATKISIENRHDTIGGMTVPLSAISNSRFPQPAKYISLASHGDAVSLAQLPAALPLGPTTYEIHAAVRVTLAVEGRPTLVEAREVQLSGPTTIVDPPTMYCPQVTQARIDQALPVDDPTNIEALEKPTPLDVPDPLPTVNLRVDQSGKPLLVIECPQVGALLGDVVLIDRGKQIELGAYLFYKDWPEIPLSEKPADGFEVLIRPRPELGVELFEVPAIYLKPVTLHDAAGS